MDKDEIEEFDRKLRSFMTATLLDNAAEQVEILHWLDDRKDNPAYTIHLVSTFAALTGYLLAAMLESDDKSELFELWAFISQNIEMDLMFNDITPE